MDRGIQIKVWQGGKKDELSRRIDGMPDKTVLSQMSYEKQCKK